MNLSDRDKRALLLLAVVATLTLSWNYLSEDNDTPGIVAASVESIPATEQRLERVKHTASLVPGKEKILAQMEAELAQRERGLIQADTAAQAQAQILQVVRRIARAQTAPIELRNTQMGPIKPFGDKYGEVAVSVNFETGIEQLINFLSDLTAQKELIGTSEIQLGQANPKQKTMPVRLTLSGLVRRELIPDKKERAF